MPSNTLTQSIKEIVSRLKAVSPTKGNDLAEIVLQYRNLFGTKYTAKPDEEIIASDVSKSFKYFLNKNHCCWLDFIGCDSFSCSDKKQLFFATVSMSKRAIGRRKEFLGEYNDLLQKYSTTIPVDIFVQLFFKDIERFREELKHESSLASAQKKNLIHTLTCIQNNGLMISFIPGTITSISSDIVSIELPCSPLPRGRKCFNISTFKSTSFDKELIAFLNSIIVGTGPTPLIRDVAKLNRSLHTDVKYLYFLPMIGSEGAIGLYCYGSKKELTQMQRSDLSILVHNILFPFVSAYKSTWESQQIVKESIKSAVSAIMSRNMSHNLGSHYLYYTKAHLENLANNNFLWGPDIRGAARVLGYMQARMDYLATIISNDKYPNGSVNFKSQIYDELTVDDFSKRHFSKKKDIHKRTTNFLLSNLILSENFSRSNITKKGMMPDASRLPLILQVKLWNGSEYETFTGSSYSRVVEKENHVKDALSRLYLALPGGTMSCHAFFNILENFIRNSAKYRQMDFKSEGLVITIAIKPTENNTIDFIIYDNKANANVLVPKQNANDIKESLLENINKQLESLRILDEDSGGVEKSSKGLKEMLFSAIWMRTYMYPNQTYADIINLIHTEENGPCKLELINKYGFTFLPVSDEGKRVNTEVLDANLGLAFTLPEFLPLAKVDYSSTENDLERISKVLAINADIIELSSSNNQTIPLSFQNYFTRTFLSSSFKEVEYKEFISNSDVSEGQSDDSYVAFVYKKILDQRFYMQTNGDIDHMQIMIGGGQDEEEVYDGNQWYDDSNCIYFERHLNSKEDLEDFRGFAYADSISGGNFTITLGSLFSQGIDMSCHKYKTWKDKFFGLKIKESALTRITIIDERLYNNMNEGGDGRHLELSLKNIRVLNFDTDRIDNSGTISDLFIGNSYRDNRPYSHFLSIHLGLIEKIVKNDIIVKRFLGEDRAFDEQVGMFMSLLREAFSEGGITPFISVHSGRGNFSKELEGPLAAYPFISLPAIENAFTNSKYLLSQLFYNNIYIGKGNINNLYSTTNEHLNYHNERKPYAKNR